MNQEFYTIILISYLAAAICANIGLYDNGEEDKIARSERSGFGKLLSFIFWYEIVINNEYRKHNCRGRSVALGIMSATLSVIYIAIYIYGTYIIFDNFIKNDTIVVIATAITAILLSFIFIPLISLLATPIIIILSIPINLIFPLKKNDK